MKTQETEKLYLSHADDFRTLLGEESALAVLDDGPFAPVSLFHKAGPSQPDGCWYFGSVQRGWHLLPSSVALAAMTDSWRERLEKKFSVYTTRGREAPWRAWRTTHHKGKRQATVLRPQGFASCQEGDGTPYDSLPELICAAVEALANEKRRSVCNEAQVKKSSPIDAAISLMDKIAAGNALSELAAIAVARHGIGRPLVPKEWDALMAAVQAWRSGNVVEKTKPSAAAMRATKRILSAEVGVNADAIAQIIDEELAKENP